MPLRYKKTHKKKVFRRRRRYVPTVKKRNKPTMAIVRAPTAFPDKMLTKLKYYEEINLSAGLSNSYFYCVNNLYDPNTSGTGHQPRGFDEYTLIYATYRVYGALFKVTFLNETNTVPVMFGMAAGNTTSGFTSSINMSENPRVVRRLVGTKQDKAILKRYYSVKRLSGRRDISDDVFEAGTAGTSGPSLSYYVNLATFSADTTGTNHDGKFIVEITFYTMFRERKRLLQS